MVIKTNLDLSELIQTHYTPKKLVQELIYMLEFRELNESIEILTTLLKEVPLNKQELLQEQCLNFEDCNETFYKDNVEVFTKILNTSEKEYQKAKQDFEGEN